MGGRFDAGGSGGGSGGPGDSTDDDRDEDGLDDRDEERNAVEGLEGTIDREREANERDGTDDAAGDGDGSGSDGEAEGGPPIARDGVATSGPLDEGASADPDPTDPMPRDGVATSGSLTYNPGQPVEEPTPTQTSEAGRAAANIESAALPRDGVATSGALDEGAQAVEVEQDRDSGGLGEVAKDVVSDPTRAPLAVPAAASRLLSGNTGAPTQDDVADAIGEATVGEEPPTEDDLGRAANAAVRDATGADPRGGSDALRRGVLETAASVGNTIRSNPLAAAGATAVALAEPTPFGEALLLGGGAAGAIGADVSMRAGELETPTSNEPAADQPELAVPESGDPVDDGSELEAPSDGEPAASGSEVVVPEDGTAPGFGRGEVSVPDGDAAASEPEVRVPDPTSDEGVFLFASTPVVTVRTREEENEDEETADEMGVEETVGDTTEEPEAGLVDIGAISEQAGSDPSATADGDALTIEDLVESSSEAAEDTATVDETVTEEATTDTTELDGEATRVESFDDTATVDETVTEEATTVDNQVSPIVDLEDAMVDEATAATVDTTVAETVDTTTATVDATAVETTTGLDTTLVEALATDQALDEDAVTTATTTAATTTEPTAVEPAVVGPAVAEPPAFVEPPAFANPLATDPVVPGPGPGTGGGGSGRPPRPRRPREDEEEPGSFDEDGDDQFVLGSTGARLTTGFLAETIATAATRGFGNVGAPSQSVLASQPRELQLTGELPTAAQVSGDAETRGRIEELTAALSFETGSERP